MSLDSWNPSNIPQYDDYMPTLDGVNLSQTIRHKKRSGFR